MGVGSNPTEPAARVYVHEHLENVSRKIILLLGGELSESPKIDFKTPYPDM